ncbi:MAG: hypothetical protein WC280_04020 [Patescibacteria group bacterium]
MKILDFSNLFTPEFLLVIVFLLLVLVAIWLVIRELKCWYWKINLRVDLLADIASELKEVKEILKSNNTNKESVEIKEDNLDDSGSEIKE